MLIYQLPRIEDANFIIMQIILLMLTNQKLPIHSNALRPILLTNINPQPFHLIHLVHQLYRECPFHLRLIFDGYFNRWNCHMNFYVWQVLDLLFYQYDEDLQFIGYTIIRRLRKATVCFQLRWWAVSSQDFLQLYVDLMIVVITFLRYVFPTSIDSGFLFECESWAFGYWNPAVIIINYDGVWIGLQILRWVSTMSCDFRHMSGRA